MVESRPARLGWYVAGATTLVLTLATCDALTAPKAEHVALAWVGDTIITAGRRVPVGVAVTVAGRTYNNPRFSVQSSDTTILSVSNDGDSLRAVRLGVVTVTVQLENVLLSGTPPTLTQDLLVAPKSVQFARTADTLHSLGEAVTPSIVALDLNGDSIPGVTYTWASNDTAILTVSQRGQILSAHNGNTKVRAVVQGDTATLPVNVSQLLVHFGITPPLALTLNAINAETTLVAAGRDSLGSAITGAAGTPLWQLQTPNVVSIDQTGRLTAINNGTTYAYAVRGSARDSVQVNVVQQATRLLVTSPNGLAIGAIGGTLTLNVVAFDRLNNPVTNDQATLVSLDPSIAQVATGTRVVTAQGLGTARIVALLDAIADTVRVVISNQPTKLVLSADTATIPAVGDTIQLTATLLNASGNVVNGLTPTWRVTDTTVITVQQNGRVTAVRTGGARVIAVFNTIADTTVVAVTNNAATLQINKRLDSLKSLGDTLTIPVTLQNARGVALPASAATWTSNDPTIASVTSNAFVTAIGVGRTTVRAASGVLRDSAIIVVTNNPVHIVLNSSLDTMTARGQTLLYTAQLTNADGNPVTGATIVWSSTVSSVASVTATGLVTALTNGTTKIVATAGSVTANATLVVGSPTTLIVDNSTLDTLSFGTLKRPYHRIGDAVSASVPGDTVFVRVGAHPYSEEVALNKAIVLTGDPTAYLAANRDPTKLPLLSHDTGTAGILSTSPARVVVRTLAIRHTLDGPAIDARTAAIQINQVYVNPSGDAFSSGRGFSVQSTSQATIDSCIVSAVHGYAVSFRNVINGRINQITVNGVVLSTALDSTVGAGIAVMQGSGNLVENDLVRLTAGPEIFVDSSATATITGNNVAGESQLMRLLASSGAQVTGNSFDTRLQTGQTFTGNSLTDGRSGLEINASPGATVAGNAFVDNAASQMDQIHIVGTRGAGVQLQRLSFQGGRFNVNSSLSDWTLSQSHGTSAQSGVFLSNADTATLASDTLSGASGPCVQVTGTTKGQLTVTGGLYAQCGPASTAAITSTATQAALDITGVVFSGASQRSVDVSSGHHVTLRGNLTMDGGFAVSGSPPGGVYDLSADSMVVVSNNVVDFPSYSGLNVDGGVLRADSNTFSQNAVGMRIGNLTTFEASRNDIFDNDTAGVVNDRASSVTLTNNFWGDSIGPRRSVVRAATGDTIIGASTFTPFMAQPVFAGTRSQRQRGVDGNGQTAPAGSTLPFAFVVRVVDAAGNPVANVNVTFTVSSGGGTLNGPTATSVMIATGSDGLARGTLTLGSTPGANAVTTSVPALANVVFTATGQ